MQYIGPYLVGAAFWIFIGAVAIAGMITDYKRRRGGIEVLRLAIEKGQEVVVTAYDRGIATVRRWDDLMTDES